MMWKICFLNNKSRPVIRVSQIVGVGQWLIVLIGGNSVNCRNRCWNCRCVSRIGRDWKNYMVKIVYQSCWFCLGFWCRGGDCYSNRCKNESLEKKINFGINLLIFIKNFFGFQKKNPYNLYKFLKIVFFEFDINFFLNLQISKILDPNLATKNRIITIFKNFGLCYQAWKFNKYSWYIWQMFCWILRKKKLVFSIQ